MVVEGLLTCLVKNIYFFPYAFRFSNPNFVTFAVLEAPANIVDQTWHKWEKPSISLWVGSFCPGSPEQRQPDCTEPAGKLPGRGNSWRIVTNYFLTGWLLFQSIILSTLNFLIWLWYFNVFFSDIFDILYPKLDTRISFVCSFVRPSCVTLRGPPLDSETGWTGELWSNPVLLILEN